MPESRPSFLLSQQHDRKSPTIHSLEPYLGVVDLGDFRSFVIADIPGLIEGAHQGAGLGDRFLRHIERTKLLLHLVDVSSASGRDPVNDYLIVNGELAAYNPALASRPQFVVATKIDALEEPQRLESLRRQAGIDGKPFFAVSSVANQGLRELVAAIGAKLDELNELRRVDNHELVAVADR
jgi:GTP-binding protein